MVPFGQSLLQALYVMQAIAGNQNSATKGLNNVITRQHLLQMQEPPLQPPREDFPAELKQS